MNGIFTVGEHAIDYLLMHDDLDTLVNKVIDYAGDDILMIADSKPLALHGLPLIEALSHRAKLRVVSITAEESEKTLAVVEKVIEKAINEGANRATTVLSFGGGLTANLAGVVAGLLFRGLPLLHLPTTFLGVSDGILSLKQAVNGRSGKNQVGLYHKPRAFLCDVKWLSTLSPSMFHAGWVEAAKNALAYDLELKPLLESVLPYQLDTRMLPSLIKRLIDSKTQVMKDDPQERKEALVLEYGHTVGHALELMHKGLSHGHAVALGMRIAARISAARGWLMAEDVEQHDSLIDLAMGKQRPDHAIDIVEIAERLRADNKRGYLRCQPDEVAMVLLKGGIGEVAWSGALPLVPVSIEEVCQTVKAMGWHRAPGTAQESPAEVPVKRVSRHHGFGNILNLLAILNGTSPTQQRWQLVTHAGWQPVLQALAKAHVEVVSGMPGTAYDLDQCTANLMPSHHRFDEFAALLGLPKANPEFTPLPTHWRLEQSWAKAKIVIAPEAGHPARTWPHRNIVELIEKLGSQRCVLVGTTEGTPIDGVIDMRGKTSVEALFGVIANAQSVVTMDSGVLHISRWTGTPTVALFGPVEPRFRVYATDRVWTLQADITCAPCNKNETCNAHYYCIESIEVEAVMHAVERVHTLQNAVHERMPVTWQEVTE